MSLTRYLQASLPAELKTDDLQKIGIAGFYADARITQSEEKTQELPITPLEDGSFLNDHIIKKPSIVTIEGSVADIKIDGTVIPKAVTRSPVELAINSLYTKARTTFQQAIPFSAPVSEVSTYNLFGVAPSGFSIQEKFIDHMSRIHDAGIVIDIETPFATLTNMALLSFTTTRTNQDKAVQYSIRAQQLEFVKIKTTAVAALKRNPISKTTTAKQENGEQQGEKVENESLLYSIFR